MIIQRNKSTANQGSALAVTLIICTILGTLMGSYLYLIQNQHLSVARSQAWNRSLIVAEAGVEEAMALLNSGVAAGNFAVFPWKNAGGGNFTNRISPPQFTNGYYAVTISTPGGTNPVIVSKSYVPGPISTPVLTRTVRVQTRPRASFPVKGPMIVNSTIDFSGFRVATDSFNSSDTNYSTAGRYDPLKAMDNGDVVTLSTDPGAVKIGNAKVKGVVRSPEGGIAGITATVGAGGSVGDAAWVGTAAANYADGQTGFQTDHFKDDVNFTFPNAVLPNVPYWLPPAAGNYKVNGVTYKYFLNNSSPWVLSDLTDSVYVTGTNVVLHVTSSIAISSGGGKNVPEIRIAPGASLTIYMSGASASIGGKGVINDTGIAKAFAYYGLPSNTSLTFGGNASFVGSIYAPQAVFSLGGGGTTTYDFIGSSITKSAKMNGHFNFHYDENLSTLTTLAGYDAISWEEM